MNTKIKHTDIKQLVEDARYEEQVALISELRKENTRLKAQLELQSQQYSFLEDCILEMADIVYA